MRFDAIVQFISQLIYCHDPCDELEQCTEQIKKVILLAPYSKHLSNRTPIRLEPTDSLKYGRAT